MSYQITGYNVSTRHTVTLPQLYLTEATAQADADTLAQLFPHIQYTVSAI